MSGREVFIVGVGMTPFGRHAELDVKALARGAVAAALADAGLVPAAIEAAYFANATQGHMEGQHMVRGEIALRALGIGRIPVVNVENACASGSTALQLAVTALKAGDADIALAVGAEKMVSTDRGRMFSVFDGAWDVADHERIAAAPIAYPLTVPMCSPISDGAAAVIVATPAGLTRYGIDAKRAVRVLAVALQSGSDRAAEDVHLHVSALAAGRAYAMAGVGPGDIDVAEVHDATAMGEIIQVENLGFCAFGDGGALAERGETAIGGRLPVNPSGGLESKGHPIGATGLAQIHELVTQLRGEAKTRQVTGARTAIAENGGGLHGIEEAVACVTILQRDVV